MVELTAIHSGKNQIILLRSGAAVSESAMFRVRSIRRARREVGWLEASVLMVWGGKRGKEVRRAEENDSSRSTFSPFFFLVQ